MKRLWAWANRKQFSFLEAILGTMVGVTVSNLWDRLT